MAGHVERGDTWRVAVDVPAEVLEDVEWSSTAIGCRSDSKAAGALACPRGSRTPGATVTMPVLESL